MTEDEAILRGDIIQETKSWLGTPYVSNGMVKGKRGGTDCAMLLIGVYGNVGLLPKEFDPRPYPPMWHVHRNEEKYMAYVRQFMTEVPGPPKREPLPGDLVLFQIGRLFAHGAIVIDWPNVIHAMADDAVIPADLSKMTTGKRALWTVPKHFFTYWPDSDE